MGHIGISVSGRDSNRIYAQIEEKKGGLYRSDDGSERWILVNDDERFRQRAWYFTHLFADPKSPDTVYILNTGLFRSTAGCKTFWLLLASHGDHHVFCIDPTDLQRLINGNDLLVTISSDCVRTSTQQNKEST